MSVRKMVYLDDETAAAAKAAADAEGVSLSAWICEAARSATMESHPAPRSLTPETWQRADATAHSLGLDLYSAGI